MACAPGLACSLPRAACSPIPPCGGICHCLRDCAGICDRAVEIIDTVLPSLRTLVLSGCDIGDLGIQLLGKHCRGLVSLDLGNCGADRITKIGVWHLALATPLAHSLQELVLPSLFGCLSGMQLLRRLRDTPDDETDDDEWSDDDKLYA